MKIKAKQLVFVLLLVFCVSSVTAYDFGYENYHYTFKINMSELPVVTQHIPIQFSNSDNTSINYTTNNTQFIRIENFTILPNNVHPITVLFNISNTTNPGNY